LAILLDLQCRPVGMRLFLPERKQIRKSEEKEKIVDAFQITQLADEGHQECYLIPDGH
jgi:uncharacterized protein (DUF169 family)